MSFLFLLDVGLLSTIFGPKKPNKIYIGKIFEISTAYVASMIFIDNRSSKLKEL